MGIISKIKSMFAAKQVSGVELMQQVGNNYISWSGKIYDADIVRSCIRPKVKAIGKLLAKHIRETVFEDGHKEMTVNPSNAVKFLLEEPNSLMTGQMLQEKMATQLILNANAFALIIRDEYGSPIEIYPIIGRTVKAIYDKNGQLLLEFQMMNNKAYTFPYEDIIHLRQDFNENDIFGTPIAPALTPLLDVVTTMDQGVMNAIKNSSVIRWLLSFTNSMRPEDLKTQAKDFADNFLATSNGTGVAAVDAKADAKQITPTDYVPNALQMDRTTKRIFDLFNTNAEIVSSKFSEGQYNAYFDAEVEPVLIQLGGEYTRKLFTRRERSFGNKIVFEASAWDSASISTKLSLVSMVDRGAMTPNEWRAALNMAPIPGGDVPIRRLDTQTVGNGILEKGGEGGED
ncbi:phage portal protein [Shuttleworthella satelles]|uniref:Phage portal protein, HK97 family n=1 Tax=Shuttleworthella satelles DSM 14600 TaxID=626523 RepID=C4GAS6_9FIRM|nr:phage portal protein [Shuttleworthia satelles]EEP28219.1 putative phage portal protein, HK97 family [Shuttleworthia satelles DSM 14600]